MKIGIDCRLPYYRMGGISQYVVNLLPALAAIDDQNNYQVFHSWKDKRSYIPESAPNFTRKNLYTPSHHSLERWSLAAELSPYFLHIFHSPDFIPPAKSSRKRIITVHDLNFVHYPEFITDESRRYYADQIEWAVESADFIIADSDHTKQDLINLLNVDEEKVRTVYLAANPIYQQKRSSKEIEKVLESYELEPGFILFVGTISPRKNIKTLLKIYEMLVSNHQIGSPMVLVGSRGWLSSELFREMDLLSTRLDIRHLEGITDLELSCLYSRAGVLALPSYYEGFGLPMLEAMHRGCPVVSSSRGSLPEVVGEAGPLLEPDDVDAWAEAIVLLLQDHEYSENARTKGKKQASKFSWDRTASQTLTLYKETAKIS